VATLPGLPDPTDPDPDTLPIQPDKGPVVPTIPPAPEHEHVNPDHREHPRSPI